jgi:hypothetical protein
MKALANFDPRNEFRLLPEKGGRPGLSIKKIQDFSIFEDFRCCPPPKPGEAESDIDDFIHNDAYRYYKDKIASTYGLFFQIDKRPVAFATLQNDAISIGPGFTPPKGYFYPQYPAVKIGRFGVRMNMLLKSGVNLHLQNNRFGSYFLRYIKHFMSQENNRTGCRYLTVNADKSDRIIKFYTRNGFVPLQDQPSKEESQIVMYFDLERVGL